MNYELAPAGATHTYKKDHWIKFVDGKISIWDKNQWHPPFSFPTDPKNLVLIPEREIALNRLADNLKRWCYHNSAVVFTNKKGIVCWVWQHDETQFLTFTKNEWEERRSARINGVVSQLHSLAESEDGFNRQEWQERRSIRIEAGLINQAEWNGEGLPPVGTICEYYGSAVEITALARNGICFYEKRLQRESYVHKTFLHRFHPIKTAEQIAAEKKKEWKLRLMGKLAFHISPDSTAENHIDLAASIVYDAMIKNELASPKDDL